MAVPSKPGIPARLERGQAGMPDILAFVEGFRQVEEVE
jgi:hypothetical protein